MTLKVNIKLNIVVSQGKQQRIDQGKTRMMSTHINSFKNQG